MIWIFADKPRRQRITIEIISVFILVNVRDWFDWLGSVKLGAYFAGLVMGNGGGQLIK